MVWLDELVEKVDKWLVESMNIHIIHWVDDGLSWLFNAWEDKWWGVEEWLADWMDEWVF